MINLDKVSIDNDINKCNGQVFKANVQHFITKNGGFGFSVRLNPMKKLSCPGCRSCVWQSENFSEVSNNYPIINIETACHGELYTIGICNESTDYESGIIDDWDLEIIGFINEKLDK